MSFLQSFLVGAVSASVAALIGWWLARRWAQRDDGSEQALADDWLDVQTGQRKTLWIVLGLLALVVVLAVFAGLVAAIWPFMEKWLFWLAVVASVAGYTLSFYVTWTLAPLPGEFGQRGRLLSWSGLAVWTLALLGLALGSHQDLYGHSIFDGMLDDLAARSMVSVGAACALYAVTIMTGLQLTALSALAQAREGQSLNGFERLAWQLTIYGMVMVAITTLAGFALASGLLL